MIQVLALLIGLFLAAPAAAQNPTCPTRGAGDSSNACASTKFVQQHPPANIDSFGAIAGDPTKAAINQTAIQNAMAANTQITCTGGATYYTQTITVPATLKSFQGSCTLVAAGSMGGAVISASFGNIGLVISGLTISINTGTYPSVIGIFTSSLIDPVLDNIKVTGGSIGLRDNTSKNYVVRACDVSGFLGRGVMAFGTNKSVVTGCYIVGDSSTQHGISFEGGSDASASFNRIINVGGFGISFAGDQTTFAPLVGFTAVGNYIEGSSLEGLQGDNVLRGSWVGNRISFIGTTTDFGMSLFGNPNTSPQGLVLDVAVSGNVVLSPCKAGIGIVDRAQRINVSANTIVAFNSCNNVSDPYSRSAITVSGGTADFIGVGANTIYQPTLANMDYQVIEIADGSGTPNFNYYGQNFGAIGSIGYIKTLGAASTKGDPCAFATGAGTC